MRTGNAQGTSKAHNQSVAVASLPAVNHPRSATISTSSNPPFKSATSLGKADQLAAFAKYNSRLAKIDVPYIMGVGVNRKGPSAHANLKDKSDRATNEQVLDPRTRLILFKMIGRGLIHEVNGCVSTGKEVRIQLYFQSSSVIDRVIGRFDKFVGQCLPRADTRRSSSCSQNIQNLYPYF